MRLRRGTGGMTEAGKTMILVVEDDADIREALAQILEDEGYEVVTAGNGLVGLEKLRAVRPSLVLLDLMMPVMNGWQFRQQQRQDEMVSEIPVLMISADGSARREALSSGARGFIQKPIELDDLLTAVAQLSQPVL